MRDLSIDTLPKMKVRKKDQAHYKANLPKEIP